MKIWLPTIKTGSGSDVFTIRLARALNECGHSVEISFFPHHFEMAPKLLRVRPPAGTDIIHGNSWTAYAFKRENIPLVVTEHHYIADPAFTPYRSNAQKLYHRIIVLPHVLKSYNTADKIVAVSNHTAQTIKKATRHPASVIHNWIDTDKFRPSERPPSELFRCLFIGNASKWKGTDIIPKLAINLGSRFELILLGGLRTPSSPVKGASNVVAHPPVSPDDMPRLYQSAHVVVIPSRYEAFGYVAAEALACGVPVVAFDTSGISEICTNNYDSLLAPLDDIDRMTHHIILLSKDNELRQHLGKNGRKKALSRFSKETQIKKYITIYEKLRETAKS